MINFSSLNKESIEKIICSQITQAVKNPMSKFEQEILVSLLLANKNFKIPQKEKPFLFQLIEKRINACHTFSTDDERVILFLVSVCQSPGSAILYLWFIQFWCHFNRIKVIDLDIFCGKIFPNGFPSTECVNAIWDSQKLINVPKMGSDNLVDYNYCGDSIHFVTVPTA